MTKPDALTPLGALCRYAGFERIHRDPPVVVTMDHRAVLVAAWAARRQGLFGAEPPLLVRFDAHPDMGERPRPWAWEHARMTDLDSALAIANGQRSDDGGWAISAMQFGLCRDVATFFVHDYHRFPGDDGAYDDHLGTEHHLYTFGGIREMRNSRAADAVAGAIATRPVWFDIDLDFATRRGEDDSVRIWSEEDWALEFDDDALAFVAQVAERAALVTVATEPWFCGGLGACGAIAEGLKAAMAPVTRMFEGL